MRSILRRPHGLLLLASLVAPAAVRAQLPATPPTASSAADLTAPISATPLSSSGSTGPQPARVTCNGGLLQVKAQNSSLNGILRSIARCTGMRISGSIPEQRVFGDYGPAEPATVLATLVDGSGTNMLLRETAADQPAELILTPRTGGATPPPVSSYADAEEAGPSGSSAAPQGLPSRMPMPPMSIRGRGFVPGYDPRSSGNGGNGTANNTNGGNGTSTANSSSQTPTLPPIQGSPVTSPQEISQPINNVNGSASNTSPTAGSYPTTDSVPLDAVRTPSTTPSTSGIVDAPNPPPAGSDTAALLSGAARGTPGTTNISPENTSDTSTPGATNATVPANTSTQGTSTQGTSTDLTPEQIFQQLQQRQRAQQQQQQQQDNDTSPM